METKMEQENNKQQRCIIDLDDYSVTAPNFELLLKLKEHFPNFKVTLFTVPLDIAVLGGKVTLKQYQQWADMLKNYKDWIEIAVHGFMHDKKEMLGSYKQSIKVLKAAEQMFKEVKFREKRFFLGYKWKKYEMDIPYVKIFKAPGWQMNKEAYEATRDRGYIVGVDRNKPTPMVQDLITYKYNWSIEESYPKDYRIIKGHGHMSGMNNDLSLCYNNLLNMPTSAKFMTVSEYMFNNY